MIKIFVMLLILNVCGRAFCTIHNEKYEESFEGKHIVKQSNSPSRKRSYCKRDITVKNIPKKKKLAELKDNFSDSLITDRKLKYNNQLVKKLNKPFFKTNKDADIELNTILEEYVDLIMENYPENDNENGSYVLVGNSYIYIDFSKFKFNLKLIEEQMAALYQKFNEIQILKTIRPIYERRFKNIREMAYKYINNAKDHLKHKIDYESSDEKIRNLIFNVKQIEGESKLFLDEEKLKNFFSLILLEDLSNLNFHGKTDYVLLVIDEFYKLQMYYKEFPELIILESIRDVPSVIYRNTFLYLRSLNVLLDQYSLDKTLFPDIKNIISSFIEKLIVTDSRKEKCDISSVKNISMVASPCDKIHNNYFYIFIYNIDYVLRSNLMGRKSSEKKPIKSQNNIKVTCLCLIYKHLIYNCYLFFKKHEFERIKEYMSFLEEKESCINCVMEDCISILSD